MTTETTVSRAGASGANALLGAGLWEGRGVKKHTLTKEQNRSLRASRAKGAGKRKLTWFMLLILPLVAIFGALGTGAAHAEDDKNAMTYSFYKVSSGMTSFFSTSQAPEGYKGSGKGFSDAWVNADPGTAGSLLGYLDPNFSFSPGWLNSKLSGSSDAIGYDTLRVKKENGDVANGDQQGMLDYAYFGAALSGLGLDGTSTGLSLNFMGFIGGGLMMLLYIMTGAIDILFQWVIEVLGFLNPFKLFFTAINAINPTFAQGMTGGDTSVWGPLSGLASWISGWYKVLADMAWTVMVPLFVGTLLLSLLLFKNMNKGSALKKLAIRLVFIGMGLPLLGSMYTGVLNTMGEATQAGSMSSTKVIMSTYVDFENWMFNSRLAVPKDANIGWNAGDNAPTGKAQANVRNTTLAINNQTHSLGLMDIVSGDTNGDWAKQAMSGESDKNQSQNVFGTTMDMLWRYMSGAQVSSASLETQMKGSINQSQYFKDHKDEVKKWFEDWSDNEEIAKQGDKAGSNPIISIQRNTGLQGTDADGGRKFTSTIDMCYFTGMTPAESDGAPRSCNMAPLAAYNYLNTRFESTSMTMYSSSNVMSEATRSTHTSVNLVGTGTMSFLYWLNAIVLLSAFVIIGFGYALALIFANIRRALQLFAAVPLATLGAMAAIAKVIVYTIALLMEIIITIFVYKFVQEFLIAIPQIIEMPFAAILNNGSNEAGQGFVAFLVAGTGFSIVVTLLSIIGVVMFTIMALRLRKTVVKAIEEAVTKLVEKLTETQVAAPSGSKMAPALAGGLAAGAGAAATNRMMTGGGAGAAAGAKTKGSGPEGLASAGGVTNLGMEGDNGNGPGKGPAPLLPGANGGAITTGGAVSINGEGGANGADGLPGAHGATGGPEGAAPGAETLALDSGQSDVELGKQVESQGTLSDGTGSYGPQAAQQEDGAFDAAADSVQSSQEGYAKADEARVGAGAEAAKGVGNAALAVGRGMAGDEAGAVESGSKAVGNLAEAGASAKDAQQAEQDAGRSSLDGPSNNQAGQQAEQMREAGQSAVAVGAVAGAASGGGKPSVAGPMSKSPDGKPSVAGPMSQAPSANGKQAQALAPSTGQKPSPKSLQTSPAAQAGRQGKPSVAGPMSTSPNGKPSVGAPMSQAPAQRAGGQQAPRPAQTQRPTPAKPMTQAPAQRVGSQQASRPAQTQRPTPGAAMNQAPGAQRPQQVPVQRQVPAPTVRPGQRPNATRAAAVQGASQVAQNLANQRAQEGSRRARREQEQAQAEAQRQAEARRKAEERRNRRR